MGFSSNIKKVCSFCVSDLHLITMLLPFLNKKINEQVKFITISEKDLNEDVKLVISKIILSRDTKDKILNINWNSSKLEDYESTEEYLIKETSQKLSLIINGSKEYIEEVNNNIDLFMKNNNDWIRNREITIINCYDITKLDDDIKFILRTHDKILNTSGEKEISEVFEGYEKRYA